MTTADMRIRPLDPDAVAILQRLLADERACVLATLDHAGPYAALAAFAVDPDVGCLLVHLSDLSEHKRQLLADPRVAVLVARADDRHTEILQHPRLSLRCRAVRLDKNSGSFEAARAVYLQRHPRHAMTFGLADFDLFRLMPGGGLLNAGFGRAHRVTAADFLAATRAEPPAA